MVKDNIKISRFKERPKIVTILAIGFCVLPALLLMLLVFSAILLIHDLSNPNAGLLGFGFLFLFGASIVFIIQKMALNHAL